MKSDRPTAAGPSGESGSSETQKIVAELRVALDRATGLLHRLQERVPGEAPAAGHPPLPDELVARLQAAESDLSELSAQLVETENQRSRLMNLYVATYQLHATLDLSEVTATIAEIARDLLGAERYVLLLREEGSGGCEVAIAEGLDTGGAFGSGRYAGGDPAIDRTLAEGVVTMEREEGSEALAVVPLTVQGAIVGALVVLKLFDHKQSFTSGDKDLLDLLAAHAASALFAARVYSATDRKLKTLESLVKLVR